MNVDISKLLDGTVEVINFCKDIDISSLPTKDKGIELLAPVNIDGSIYRVDEDLFINATITYTYKESCARCLTEFSNKVSTVLLGRLVEQDSNVSEEEIDEILVVYKESVVDLQEFIVSAILLSLPMKALCDEACKGLCPKCGQNLNLQKCNCEDDFIDPRLEKLKELLD
ncbi:YceD family protein [Caloranaerobacter sp. DY30410]|uniref:YceD family protein n=1 Tax=Caloranaerobacter sp. DY30410 TaxID=3238305 RepID=UPI003CFDA419